MEILQTALIHVQGETIEHSHQMNEPNEKVFRICVIIEYTLDLCALH